MNYRLVQQTYGALRRNLAEPPSPADVASVVRATPFGSATTAFNALLFAVARWNTLGGPALAVWCAATLAVCLFVFLKSWRVRNVSVERVSRRASRQLCFTTFLLALPWGVLSVGFLPIGREYDQLLILIVCSGMFSGAALMLQRTLSAMLFFVVTVNLGIIAGCIIAGFPSSTLLILYDLIVASWLTYAAFAAGETARERDRTLKRLSQANGELEAANRKISSFAYVDPLTGLPSRKAFSEAIERDIETARRNGHRYCVLMLDLDNFKNVNDSFGHQFGDELLSVTGRRIAGLLDSQSTVARLGGDEFAVLAPLDETHDPVRLASRLIEAVTEPLEFGGRRVVPGTSVGIAILPDHAASPTELLSNADAALRQAKDMGKGRIVVYDTGLGLELDRARMIAGELKKALDADGLEIFYQPKFDLQTGDVCGVEALLRWFHPHLGELTPDQFLPVAVERGTMQQLSAFIFRRVAEDIHAWREAEADVGKVAININPVDLKAPEHLMKMIDSLGESGATPADVVLEITEGCFVGRGTEAAPQILEAISQKGYELSLDDFGTGHAALTHLHSLPVNEIKIDRSFVASIDESQSARAIVSAIIAIAKGMGLRSVAEGVETHEQLLTLEKLGANCGQGYYWSPAVPADRIAALVCEPRNGGKPKDERRGSGHPPVRNFAANS
mgnify:CR=1 FL=1